MSTGRELEVADSGAVEALLDRMAADIAPGIGDSDELELLHERPRLDEETLDLQVRDRHLILVDDVLYTGETLFRAACFLRARGARRMQVAVLCARGEPHMPIRAEFVGRHLDVGRGHVVDCRVPPYEDRLGIVVRESGG